MSREEIARDILRALNPGDVTRLEDSPVGVGLMTLDLEGVWAKTDAAARAAMTDHLRTALTVTANGDVATAFRVAGAAIAKDPKVPQAAKAILRRDCIFCGYGETAPGSLKTILEFGVWTLGLALAIPLWLHSTFLPREQDEWFWLVVGAMGLSVLSVLLGSYFRMVANRRLVEDAEARPDEDVLWWGRWHAYALLGAMALSAVTFVNLKVFGPAPGEPCNLRFTAANGSLGELSFKCSAGLKEAMNQ